MWRRRLSSAPRSEERTKQVIKTIRTFEQRLFLVSKVMGVGLAVVLVPMALTGQFNWD